MPVSTVKLNGTTLMTVNDTTATQGDVINKYFYAADGTKTLGTASGGITPTGNINITQAGQTDVTQYATATVQAGTEGTPSASKGTVSNHSVSVTPSVTNTTGYITGSTKTGTAVSVTASELVSGTYTVSASGTHDVTNYASASVASGTATASATKGTVSNHSVTVTPSVTRTAGYITAGSSNGTAVTVSASELVSGSQTISQNGTVDVTNLASVVVSVEGGGSSASQNEAYTTLASASSSITFTGLAGEPTTFSLMSPGELSTPSGTPYKVAMLAYDGNTIHGQTITNTSNAQVTYDGSSFSKSYSNGALTISSTGAYFQAVEYTLFYTYGGTSANIETVDVQVGSGATSITFTGLLKEPLTWSCIFKSNFSTSSGYQRVIGTGFNPDDGDYGIEMDSSAKFSSQHWSSSYSNGSLTITSNGTNQGGYFHQPGYYQLTAVYEDIEPQEIDVVPLSVTTNGTYTAPSGTAYSPVTVNVSSGGANIATATMTNSNNQSTSIAFTLPSGRTPKAFFARLTSQIARNSSSRYYYVYDMRWDGSSNGGVEGNTFYMYNGTLTNVTSGYSHSQSGTTFTLSSTGSRSASPGSFFNGTYELVYIY